MKQLTLLGLQPRIEQVTIDQSTTWFRIRVGPERDLAKARNTVELLDAHGMQVVLIRVRDD